MTWVRVGDLGGVIPEYRDALLARAVTSLILLSVIAAMEGPAGAAAFYASCAEVRNVRVSGPDILIRAEP